MILVENTKLYMQCALITLELLTNKKEKLYEQPIERKGEEIGSSMYWKRIWKWSFRKNIPIHSPTFLWAVLVNSVVHIIRKKIWQFISENRWNKRLCQKSQSSPRINGILYKLYKRCPKILALLWKLLRKAHIKKFITVSWGLADESIYQKKKTPKNSLLNVEGKIFFSVIT